MHFGFFRMVHGYQCACAGMTERQQPSPPHHARAPTNVINALERQPFSRQPCRPTSSCPGLTRASTACVRMLKRLPSRADGSPLIKGVTGREGEDDKFGDVSRPGGTGFAAPGHGDDPCLPLSPQPEGGGPWFCLCHRHKWRGCGHGEGMIKDCVSIHDRPQAIAALSLTLNHWLSVPLLLFSLTNLVFLA